VTIGRAILHAVRPSAAAAPASDRGAELVVERRPLSESRFNRRKSAPISASDGLEFDQDVSPILTGYVCYGTWIKLGDNRYGLTHPFFTFQDVNTNGEGSESTEGQWDGNSAYFAYQVNVDKTGETFAGKMVLKIVQGPDPYDPNATVLFTGTFNLSASKIKVDKKLLP
jgi:hypothetical protein